MMYYQNCIECRLTIVEKTGKQLRGITVVSVMVVAVVLVVKWLVMVSVVLMVAETRRNNR